MKKLIAILPIVMLVGAFVATSAFAANTQDTVTVSANIARAAVIDIAIKSSTGADLTTIGFGTVPNTATDHRTKQTAPADGAFVNYFVGAGTHELRVWFDNYPITVVEDPTKALAGLKATVGGTDYFWPLKIWCPNFGYRSGQTTPTPADLAEGGPNPDDKTASDYPVVDLRGKEYWDIAWSWIYERAFKVNGFDLVETAKGYPAGTYKSETRTKLSWSYPTGTPIPSYSTINAPLNSGFRVDLGIDALDSQYAVEAATNYSGTLVFHLEQTP